MKITNPLLYGFLVVVGLACHVALVITGHGSDPLVDGITLGALTAGAGVTIPAAASTSSTTTTPAAPAAPAAAPPASSGAVA